MLFNEDIYVENGGFPNMLFNKGIEMFLTAFNLRVNLSFSTLNLSRPFHLIPHARSHYWRPRGRVQ